MKNEDSKKPGLADQTSETFDSTKASIVQVIKPELTDEAIKERQFLSGMLIQQTDDLAKEAKSRKKKREEEEIILRSGAKISFAQIKQTITAIRQPYVAAFPNSNPFYKEIYRLNGWTNLDPNSYIKPPIVADWTIELIYNRIGKDIFPVLSVLNPALPNGIRLHKCFQFLTTEARIKFEQYRDEAIEVMRTCSDWYEFRQKMYIEYGITYQVRIS